MDTLQCAIVLAKMTCFDDEILARQRAGQYYDKLFMKNDIRHVVQRIDRTSVFAQYTLQLENRDLVQETLKDAGVPTSIHYPVPLHRQPAYQKYCEATSMPIASEVSSKVLSLPMHPYIDQRTQEDIARLVISSEGKCPS